MHRVSHFNLSTVRTSKKVDSHSYSSGNERKIDANCGRCPLGRVRRQESADMMRAEALGSKRSEGMTTPACITCQRIARPVQ